jgi:hypothetical protein
MVIREDLIMQPGDLILWREERSTRMVFPWFVIADTGDSMMWMMPDKYQTTSTAACDGWDAQCEFILSPTGLCKLNRNDDRTGSSPGDHR